MKAALKAIAKSPLTYVVCFGVFGAVSVVCGVAYLAGLGWALVSSGVFLLAAAAYITRGMTPNV